MRELDDTAFSSEPEALAPARSMQTLVAFWGVVVLMAGILVGTAILPAQDRIDRHQDALRDAELKRDAALTEKQEKEARLASLEDPFTVLQILVSEYHWRPTDDGAAPTRSAE